MQRPRKIREESDPVFSNIRRYPGIIADPTTGKFGTGIPYFEYLQFLTNIRESTADLFSEGATGTSGCQVRTMQYLVEKEVDEKKPNKNREKKSKTAALLEDRTPDLSLTKRMLYH